MNSSPCRCALYRVEECGQVRRLVNVEEKKAEAICPSLMSGVPCLELIGIG